MQEIEEEGGADGGGDDPDGQFGGQNGPGQQVRIEEEGPAGQGGVGEEPAVVRADDEPDPVGSDQADEADDAAPPGLEPAGKLEAGRFDKCRVM